MARRSKLEHSCGMMVISAGIMDGLTVNTIEVKALENGFSEVFRVLRCIDGMSTFAFDWMNDEK